MANERRGNRLKTPKKKPKVIKPRKILGIDGTKFGIDRPGWATLIIVIDWYTKEILGYEISLRNKSSQWITALQEALFNGYPEGAMGKGIKLVSDYGSQPTSKSFMKFCSELGIKQIFASYNNLKGNAETEWKKKEMKKLHRELNKFSEFLVLIFRGV
ncbi:DDE-type integrase/transposase/recombinase [Desulfurobacterium atlanticum]|uniref:Integrase core domain-containing protein n=1 Tax=Desulfurobacterium atlanticum TaxID=240169 RepID=A0A238XPA0_9BACT|nr:Integrase core domain-containing protein [Desulfurobacterium atlanticum]